MDGGTSRGNGIEKGSSSVSVTRLSDRPLPPSQTFRRFSGKAREEIVLVGVTAVSELGTLLCASQVQFSNILQVQICKHAHPFMRDVSRSSATDMVLS